ncbi:type I-F CRISPR-associated endoribonuclease Cas6/Csy4 [Photobacterium carnosum]|uniref:type I-F CRISPR-associated endoribonuclease Cas6/Csy4 n=1 Tax=Photobacterium carnosum TaxID=2023717 RepID=UPI001E5B0D88|nr:type I-F CRISPR-associated endoribonuclease Cas6/Csy4 [Photobacterium carnosum]MCD9523204.1 type I-F CRISPR-associated endoribonuclease Cas6/Csy4 [Photobacterium carnosum]
MNQRYFVVIRYLVDDIDVGLVAGRCISILHGVLCSKANKYRGIGVAFPQWSSDNLGNEIAFVSSDKSALQFLINQPYFEMMVSDNVFAISCVCIVPNDLPEVRFKRNQNIAKCFTGEKRRRLERAKRRAKERGEIFEPINDYQNREVGIFHRVFMTSKQSGQRYILHIQKELSLSVSDTFTSYGFATNKEYQGSVPDLSSQDPFL